MQAPNFSQTTFFQAAICQNCTVEKSPNRETARETCLHQLTIDLRRRHHQQSFHAHPSLSLAFTYTHLPYQASAFRLLKVAVNWLAGRVTHPQIAPAYFSMVLDRGYLYWSSLAPAG